MELQSVMVPLGKKGPEMKTVKASKYWASQQIQIWLENDFIS